MTQSSRSRGGLVPSRPLSLSKKIKRDTERPLIISALRGGLIGMGVSLTLGLVLVTAATVAAYANPDPTALIPALSLVSLLISMFTCGFVTSKVVGEAPLTCGVVSGGMTTLVTIAVGIVLFFLPSAGYGLGQAFALHIAAVAFSILGAFAGGVKLAPKRSKHRFGK